MDTSLVPAISALVGALIGGAASFGAIYIQSKIGDRRVRLRQVTELALEDFKLKLQVATDSGRKVSLPPIVVYVHFYDEVMRAMENGTLTPERLREIGASSRLLNEGLPYMDEVKQGSAGNP